MTMRPPQESNHEEDDSDASSIDVEVLKSYASFASRAIRKRLGLVAGVFLAVTALVVGILSVWPRSYYAETKLTAHGTGALASDDREDPASGFNSASASLLGHDNLRAMVKQTELARYWEKSRSPLHRLKDEVVKRVRGEPSEEDKAAVLLSTLQQRLIVDSSFGILTIGASWPDAQMAARLVEAARQNFLEMRHISEISMLAENISILEGHGAKVRNDIYEIAQTVKTLQEGKRQKVEQQVAARVENSAPAQPARDAEPVRSPRPVTAAAAAIPPAVDEELAGMTVLLGAKQQALKELETDRGRTLRDLESKLRELMLTYTEVHPQVVHVKMNMESLTRDSPQITALRAEVKDLEQQVKQRSRLAAVSTSSAPRRGGGGPRAAAAATEAEATSTRLPSELMSLVRDSVGEIDPTVTTQFELAVRRYSELQDKISAARLDLDRAQAAFKHRYKIMVPAEVPNAPAKPKVKLLAVGGIIFALLLGLLAALISELRTGKMVERWQVQQLQLPILAELKLPPGPSS